VSFLVLSDCAHCRVLCSIEARRRVLASAGDALSFVDKKGSREKPGINRFNGDIHGIDRC
jgi:hypothetical protein